MRRLVSTVLTFSLLACFSMLWSSDADAQSPDDRVVILLCVQSSSSPSMVVRSANSSEGAPTFNGGESCAQALADLMDDGFNIEDVEPAFRAALIYTLESDDDGNNDDNDDN